jgi:phosphoglycerate dehydrogenase-like enzyme
LFLINAALINTSALVGYDPGLSIQSALKLPRDLTLADSIASAVSHADYVSINIPYIKGENGTHGIIGEEVISHFKPNTVLLNFARGELVDSQALKTFLDNGNGRYVSDFPDDLLWDHKNAIILPHLGASTEEAEDAAVSRRVYNCCCLVALNGIAHNLFHLCPITRLPWQPTQFASFLRLGLFEIP